LKFARDNKICEGKFFHRLSNALLNICTKYETAKDNLDILNKKYGSHDAGSQNYIRWLKFTSKEDKHIID